MSNIERCPNCGATSPVVKDGICGGCVPPDISKCTLFSATSRADIERKIAALQAVPAASEVGIERAVKAFKRAAWPVDCDGAVAFVNIEAGVKAALKASGEE